MSQEKVLAPSVTILYSNIEGEGIIKDIVTIKDVVYCAAEAWGEITPETIKKKS